jgi:hypothetical protein
MSMSSFDMSSVIVSSSFDVPLVASSGVGRSA